MKNYYDILGISSEERQLSEDEFNKICKKKYYNLCNLWHPDKFATESEEKKKEAEEKFKEINEAYSVLSDKNKRAQYDNPQPEGFGGMPFGFNPFNPFGNRQERINKGSDIVLNIKLSIEEAYKGTLKKLKFKKKVHCSSCNGTGSEDGNETTCPYCHGTGMFREESNNGNMFFVKQTVCPNCGGTGKVIKNKCKHCNGTGLEEQEVIEEFEIPAGIFTGAAMNMEGKGNMPKGEGIPGDIILSFTVNNDDYYQVKNLDIVHIEEIPFNEALLGTEIEVKLLDGTTKKIKIEEGTPDGKNYLIRGKGMPDIRYFLNYGNFIVTIKFKYPKKLSSEQKELLKQFKW